MTLLRRFVLVVTPLFCVAISGRDALADDWFGDPIVTPIAERPLRLAVADFDQDGIDDVVANTTADYYAIFRGHPSGNLELVQTISGDHWGTVKPFEENQDDWPDLIGEEPGNVFRVWRNDGTGLLVDSGITIPGYGVLSIGRLPGDDYQDVMVKSGWDSLTVYYGGPHGLTLDSVPVPLRAPGELSETYLFRHAALFDLNLDGVLDVFATGSLYYEWLPEMRWRLGQRDGSFGELQQFGFYSPMSEFDLFDIRDMNGDGDPEIAVMWVGFEWGDTKIYTYRKSSGTMAYQCLAPSTGVPRIEHLDGDFLADIMMSGSETTRIYRNLGGNSYQFAQAVAGRGPVLGSISGQDARDLIYTAWEPRELHVRRSLVLPASVEEREPDPRPRLLVAPTFAVSEVRIELRGADQGQSARRLIDVFDVSGRRVALIPIHGGRGVWNLRNDSGARLGSGIYWLRTRERAGRPAIARVQVLH